MKFNPLYPMCVIRLGNHYGGYSDTYMEPLATAQETVDEYCMSPGDFGCILEMGCAEPPSTDVDIPF